MAEWLYEAGIGEARAALVDRGVITAAAIELEGVLPVGTVARARLAELLPGRGARVIFADGRDALLAAAPRGVTIGATLTVEITREPIPEPGRVKQMKARATDADPAPGPALLDRIAATGFPIRHLRAHETDALEAAGWSELLEEARTGDIDFPGGTLRMTPTPAMTLFDVDGGPPLGPLAVAAARSVGQAVARHGIGGSIGIDFPTLANKAERQAVAAALDEVLPPPFERTAVNGFGFLQIVRPRPRASLPELIRVDPVAAAARAAMRQLEREPPGSPALPRLPSTVVGFLEARPPWLAELARRTGVVRPLERLR